ncbi:hypothetical protein LR48_Vigan205s009400 [Vigna angularis]|uniref:Uncharacterized protein n=1 Tax=Phaseolus angularis TaxID=3914 RepID=A0A0L9T5V8_PHAAN|nr:hypothetical protein LR48_Vigan205s009400 [Vigna angularis]
MVIGGIPGNDRRCWWIPGQCGGQARPRGDSRRRVSLSRARERRSWPGTLTDDGSDGMRRYWRRHKRRFAARSENAVVSGEQRDTEAGDSGPVVVSSQWLDRRGSGWTIKVGKFLRELPSKEAKKNVWCSQPCSFFEARFQHFPCEICSQQDRPRETYNKPRF